MEILRNDYGEISPVRVAIATLLAIGLGVGGYAAYRAIFHAERTEPAAQEEAKAEKKEKKAPEKEEPGEDARHSELPASVLADEAAAGLSASEADALDTEVAQVAEANGIELSTLTHMQVSEDEGGAKEYLFSVEGSETSIVASRGQGGTWTAHVMLPGNIKLVGETLQEYKERVEADVGYFDSSQDNGGIILLSQTEAFAKHVSPDVAAAVWAQAQESGIEGIGDATLSLDSVRVDGDVTSFELSVPVYFGGGSDRDVYAASYDKADGLLSIELKSKSQYSSAGGEA